MGSKLMKDQSIEGKLSPFLQRQRIQKALPYLHGSILDIGCGNGALADHCNPKNYLGFDISAEVLQIATNLHPLYTFTSELPTGKEFDRIIMLAVIEHITDPIMILTKLMFLLKDDGKIIITTPSPNSDWIHSLGSKLKLFSQEAHDQHQELFDYPKFSALLDNTPLEIIEHRKFLFLLNQIFILKKKA